MENKEFATIPPYWPFLTSLVNVDMSAVLRLWRENNSKVQYFVCHIYAFINAVNKGRTFGRLCHKDSSTASHLVDNLTTTTPTPHPHPIPPKNPILPVKFYAWTYFLTLLQHFLNEINIFIYILYTLSVTWRSILLDCCCWSSYFVVLQVGHQRGYISTILIRYARPTVRLSRQRHLFTCRVLSTQTGPTFLRYFQETKPPYHAVVPVMTCLYKNKSSVSPCVS